MIVVEESVVECTSSEGKPNRRRMSITWNRLDLETLGS